MAWIRHRNNLIDVDATGQSAEGSAAGQSSVVGNLSFGFNNGYGLDGAGDFRAGAASLVLVAVDDVRHAAQRLQTGHQRGQFETAVRRVAAVVGVGHGAAVGLVATRHVDGDAVSQRHRVGTRRCRVGWRHVGIEKRPMAAVAGTGDHPRLDRSSRRWTFCVGRRHRFERFSLVGQFVDVVGQRNLVESAEDAFGRSPRRHCRRNRRRSNGHGGGRSDQQLGQRWCQAQAHVALVVHIRDGHLAVQSVHLRGDDVVLDAARSDGHGAAGRRHFITDAQREDGTRRFHFVVGCR